MWKIRNIVKRGNYLNAVVPEHPNATIHGYVLLHRVIAENTLGRLLLPNEEVHHIDLNPMNNEPSNLMVCTGEQHRWIHNHYRWTAVLELCCPWCSNYFYRNKNNCHPYKSGQIYTSCSRQCSAYFSGYIKENGYDKEVNARLARNISAELRRNFMTGFIEYL